LNAGVSAGVVGGVAVGATAYGDASSGPSMAGVAKDATRGVYLPATAAQWTTALAVAGIVTGNPSALWLSQEASGNLADSIGTFTMVGNGTGLAYQQSVAGWSTKAVTTIDGDSGKFQNTDSGLPDISTTSILILSYVNLPASFGGTERSIITTGASFHASIGADSAPNSNPAKLALAQGGGTDGGTQAVAATSTTGVHPVIVQMNIATSTPAVVTDKDFTTAALSASQSGKKIVLGGDNAAVWNGASAGYLYTAAFFGTAAELTKTQIKSLLTTLGWTVAWS
jgi:hypothetical protein